jgi:hypothetical protein
MWTAPPIPKIAGHLAATDCAYCHTSPAIPIGAVTSMAPTSAEPAGNIAPGQMARLQALYGILCFQETTTRGLCRVFRRWGTQFNPVDTISASAETLTVQNTIEIRVAPITSKGVLVCYSTTVKLQCKVFSPPSRNP